MAGNARADERDHPDGEPAVGAPTEREVAAQPASRDDRPATPDGPERASRSPEPEPARDDRGREAPRDIQGRATPEVARHRAAPHEAQGGRDGPSEAPELGRNPEVEESALPPHEPGSMDISVHEATYQRFVGIVIRAVIVVFVVLVLLALVNG